MDKKTNSKAKEIPHKEESLKIILCKIKKWDQESRSNQLNNKMQNLHRKNILMTKKNIMMMLKKIIPTIMATNFKNIRKKNQ